MRLLNTQDWSGLLRRRTITPEFFYFDLGKVVVTFDHAIACRRIAHMTDCSLDQICAAIFASGLQQRYELGEITERQFYEAFCSAVGKQPDFAEFLRAGSAIFELNEPVVDIIRQMSIAGHRLGILSNTCVSHWNYLNEGRFRVLRNYFELAVLSFEVKCAKPNRAIYEHAAQRAAVAPERIFFVDDQPANIAGAAACGWDAVQFETAQQLRHVLQQRGLAV